MMPKRLRKFLTNDSERSTLWKNQKRINVKRIDNKHAWVIRNKDFGCFVKDGNLYTSDLYEADLFRTRQDARDSIRENENVEQEMPMKVLLFHGKRFLIDENSQFYLVFQ